MNKHYDVVVRLQMLVLQCRFVLVIAGEISTDLDGSLDRFWMTMPMRMRLS